MQDQSLAEQHLDELLTLPPEVLAELRYRWDLWARPSQVPPSTPWSIYLDIGGVGSGKTRSASEWVRSKIEAAEAKGERLCIGFVGRTAKDVRDVMVLGESGILSVYPGADRSWYRSSHSKVVFPGGSEIIMLTSELPDIKGFQFHYAWMDEAATYANLEKTAENLRSRLRLGLQPQLFITCNPTLKHRVPWLARIIDDPASEKAIVRTSATLSNAAFLPDDYVDRARRLASTTFGRMEFGGELLDLQGGLFRKEWFKYMPEPPPGGETFVGVDPAVRSAQHNDETGIVVVRRNSRNVYVLADLSGHWSPEQWSARVSDAVKTFNASAVVAEVSRGYDTIVSVLRQSNKSVPIRQVQAHRSKDLRAVPVASLYEQGRVFHCERFERLEEQMIAFDPATQATQRERRKAGSPDRMDALVWAISEFRLHLQPVPPPRPLSPGSARLPTSGF